MIKPYWQDESGNIQIYNADCMDVLTDMPDKSVDLVLTDPPYGINYLSPWTNNHAKIENDEIGDWTDLMEKVLPEFKRIITDSGCCCCCCCGGGKTPVTALFTIEAIKHFNLIQTLVWRKFIGLGWKYRPAYENILILSKSKNDYNFYDTSKTCSNVFEGINQDIPNAEEHPTQKPVKLMQRLLKIHSIENYLVLDPFLGGGSTAEACAIMKRRCIGIEISKEYCDIAIKRVIESQKQYELDGI